VDLKLTLWRVVTSTVMGIAVLDRVRRCPNARLSTTVKAG
jgi:hypothetical protein